jgi:tRNA-specific 2-thiouridylase
MSQPRVLVAMSGGVDSSVAALLLQRRGFEVVGATLNNWSYEGRQEPYNECCSLEVRTTCQQLGIEHHLIDVGSEFKQKVVDLFLRDYALGITPSPCQRCNRWIRFPALLAWAEKLGCAFLATGHHARITESEGIFYLRKGIDSFKDQSYYLFGLSQQELRKILLPIGDYAKQEIWKIAREDQLVSARKPESMDLCFIPNGDYRTYLKTHMSERLRPGEIVTTDGHVIGRHEGLANYTIGQRKGLGISLGERAYVVSLNTETNQLVIGEEADLLASGLIAKEVNFVYLEKLREPIFVEVKVRYRSTPVRARLSAFTITHTEDKYRLDFEEPQKAVTPGQTVVFYQGDRVVGGGTIDAALKA